MLHRSRPSWKACKNKLLRKNWPITTLESNKSQRGKGEAGMDKYQVRTWEGWHHHMALTLIAVWFLLCETHRGQQWTPALTLPQVRYGLSVLLLEV